MKYRARTGINVPSKDGTERRYEAGELIDALPAASARWLLDLEAIEPADARTTLDPVPASDAPKPEDVQDGDV